MEGSSARAAWLAGSHARGEAGEHSDIDLGLLADAGAGPGYRLERRDGYLLSIAWTTVDASRASFDDPALLGAAVAGWRRAVIIRDPDGIAAELKQGALEWDWARAGDRADRWVAEQVTGYAEEVHKLVAAVERADGWTTAAQRSVLALRLPVVLSVHLRLLYDSENVLYRLVAEAQGEPWAGTQATALVTSEQASASDGWKAALRLYALAADQASTLLDARQEAVVSHAVRLVTGTLAR